MMKPMTGMKALVRVASKAAQQSYSPYSLFPVGAGLMTAGGAIYVGCNVENASFGLTICAERTAVANAVSDGHQKFKALAVVGGMGKAVHPCGACLQVLAEFCEPDFPIILAPLNDLSKMEVTSLGALLPHTFVLKKKA